MIIVRETSQMFITGPDVVKAVTGELVSHNGLGGADVHGGGSGVAGFVYDDEQTCLEEVRYLVSLLPPNNRELPPKEITDDPATGPAPCCWTSDPPPPARPMTCAR
jgi:acetyl-CoA carboxylase carboxyltransferase component